MSTFIPPEIWAWLRHKARNGSSMAQPILALLERVEALEQLHQAVVDLNERFSLEPLVARVDALEDAAQPQLVQMDIERRIAALEAAAQQQPAAEEAPAPAPPPATPEPRGYAYRYPSILGGNAIRFTDGRDINGIRPIEAIPYWLGEPPMDLSSAAAPPAPPAPPAAPAGGLVERVAAQMTGDEDPCIDARAAIREVAEWLQQHTGVVSNGGLWAGILRIEAAKQEAQANG